MGLLAFFYANFCGRLAYTYQNAGLYLQAMFQLGDGDPSVAWVNGGWMFLVIVVGVTVAYLVSWITYAERDLSIVPGEGSLLPIRGGPLGHAAQVTVTMLLAQYVFFALDMPPDANTYSLFMVWSSRTSRRCGADRILRRRHPRRCGLRRTIAAAADRVLHLLGVRSFSRPG